MSGMLTQALEVEVFAEAMMDNPPIVREKERGHLERRCYRWKGSQQLGWGNYQDLVYVDDAASEKGRKADFVTFVIYFMQQPVLAVLLDWLMVGMFKDGIGGGKLRVT
jgi:hypothetical protein